ncbi:MAG: c-type cytochrome [Saprospiraceae bacterium]|nr:c-type cytochrome [Saprospiraceae bacterium]
MTSKKYLPTLFLLLAGLTTGWGQTVQTAAAATVPANTGHLPELMTTVFLTAVAVLFTVSLMVLFKTNAFLMQRLLRFEAEKNGVVWPEAIEVAPVPQGDSFWTKMRKKYWENAVPVEREGDITFHHDYDGIRELDNHLPPWWVNMFAICIIWSVGYMWYYHWGGDGANQIEEYKMEVETAKKAIAVVLAGKANSVDEANVVALTDGSALGEGELIFKGNCVACHGQKGEGTVGPNFTDEYWIHGGGIKNVFKIIKYGVPDKGMIAWQAQLKPADMQKVASYILTLEGTNPPNPKAPQGVIWQEDRAGQDSTKVGAVESKL